MWKWIVGIVVAALVIGGGVFAWMKHATKVAARDPLSPRVPPVDNSKANPANAGKKTDKTSLWLDAGLKAVQAILPTKPSGSAEDNVHITADLSAEDAATLTANAGDEAYA